MGDTSREFISGIWKILLASALSAVLAVIGASYTLGKSEGSLGQRMSRVEDQLEIMQATLNTIAVGLDAQRDQQTAFQQQLDIYNLRSADRWTANQQEIFALKLQIENPSLVVPNISEITGNQKRP